MQCQGYVFFFFFFFQFYLFIYFTILYWFCHTLTWICHGCTCVPHPEPPSSLPPIPSFWVIPVRQPQAPYIEPGLAICFTCNNLHVSMPFSYTIPPSPSPTESKRPFYTSVSLLLSHIQGYPCHLSKFHIYALVYCIGWRRKWQPTPVFLPGEFQGWGSLVGFCLWGRTESDTTEVT